MLPKIRPAAPLAAALAGAAFAAGSLLTPSSLQTPAAALDHHDEAGLEGPYRKATIDVGVIVSDIQKAEEFYEEALGFEEIDEFDVSAEVAGKSGLTDNKKFTADVMAIADSESATRIKLIEIADAPGARPDNAFIHSTYGPSYLTLHVDDIDAALKKAAGAGVKPLKDGPVRIAANSPVYIALIRDPDGNFIEFVGPRPNAAGERLKDAADELGDAAEAAGDALEGAGEQADPPFRGVKPGVIDQAPRG